MSQPVRLALRQGSPTWLEARRSLITSTDIPVLLGISPWKCEADLADEKLGIAPETAPSVRMRIGSLLQDLIGEEYSRITGRKAKPVRDLWVHPEIPWAAASPDFRVVGERRLVEAKRTASRTRFADGLPQDVEAQCVWALGVSGFDVSDVAVLLGDDGLLEPIPEVRFDATLFGQLVEIAEDFRRRLVEGGPFYRDAARVKRDYPTDNGTEMVGGEDEAVLVRQLLNLRAEKATAEKAADAIETALKVRMGAASRMTGQGWSITWKRTKDVASVDWQAIAEDVMPADQRDALIAAHTTVRDGFRPFRVSTAKEG